MDIVVDEWHWYRMKALPKNCNGYLARCPFECEYRMPLRKCSEVETRQMKVRLYKLNERPAPMNALRRLVGRDEPNLASAFGARLVL